MRHKWLLLMCVGVILVQATLANTEDGSNSQNEPEEGENQAEFSDQQSTQSPRTALDGDEQVHSNRELKGYEPAVRGRPTKKPPSICTKSNFNYDCILQNVRLNHNEPNVFGLDWKDNPQKNVTFIDSSMPPSTKDNILLNNRGNFTAGLKLVIMTAPFGTLF
ncbi:hypothetical protein pipiens_006725 [Culex pipiens pipiens]|uniref:Uncharacterized protein n=1 Tax=Culex pipiens pipiens TaxID=38569 RepID=A0ABD1DNX9_CULPP